MSQYSISQKWMWAVQVLKTRGGFTRASESEEFSYVLHPPGPSRSSRNVWAPRVDRDLSRARSSHLSIYLPRVSNFCRVTGYYADAATMLMIMAHCLWAHANTLYSCFSRFRASGSQSFTFTYRKRSESLSVVTVT